MSFILEVGQQAGGKLQWRSWDDVVNKKSANLVK